MIVCDISRAIYLADFNQICKDITFGRDEFLIIIGDLDQIFKVTVAHKRLRWQSISFLDGFVHPTVA